LQGFCDPMTALSVSRRSLGCADHEFPAPSDLWGLLLPPQLLLEPRAFRHFRR